MCPNVMVDVEDILFESNEWLYDIDPIDNDNDSDNSTDYELDYINDNYSDSDESSIILNLSDGHYLNAEGGLVYLWEHNELYCPNKCFENHQAEKEKADKENKDDEEDESEDEKLLVEDEPHLSNEVLHDCIITIGSTSEPHNYNNENFSTSLELNSDTTTNTEIGLNSDTTTNTEIGLNSDTTTNGEIGLYSNTTTNAEIGFNSNTTTNNVMESNPDTTTNTGYGFMSGIDFVVMDCIIRRQPEQSVNGQPEQSVNGQLGVAQHTTDILAKSSNNKNITE